jgi:hypothetical protein
MQESLSETLQGGASSFSGMGAACGDYMSLLLPCQPGFFKLVGFTFLVSAKRQIFLILIINNGQMEDVRAIPRIIEALRTRGGVVVTFEDSKCAVYPAVLLYAMFPTPTNWFKARATKNKLQLHTRFVWNEAWAACC